MCGFTDHVQGGLVARADLQPIKPWDDLADRAMTLQDISRSVQAVGTKFKGKNQVGSNSLPVQAWFWVQAKGKADSTSSSLVCL
eukprot:2467517-Amphidinium_carterae.2